MPIDPRFLIEAASRYSGKSASDNMTEMLMYVWNMLTDEEQEEAVEIWNHPQPADAGQAVPVAAMDIIKEFEGCHKKLRDGRITSYPDPIHGWSVPTIGYGTTRYPDGEPVRRGDIITVDEAESYLKHHVNVLCRKPLEKIPTWVQMNSNQRSALYSFAYNLGAHFYGGRKFQSITRVCNSPQRWSDRAWVTAQFIKYRNPGTPAEPGLRRRREAEATLFCKPV